ncbi:unnamed protein product [Lactuca saligna]|uniref:Uncharacterized protein n=1 Tax=Lactuca saligna TaxID=75948 RepID=A0AA36ENQ5_LACSI|nr:unnamed protein product [Lactuca saligna]
MIQNHQTLHHLSCSGIAPDAFSHCLVGNGGGGGILVLGYDRTTNDWDNYSRYVDPDGVDLSHGVYGHGYAPYGPYSPTGSPMPTVGQYGELYRAQHYY